MLHGREVCKIQLFAHKKFSHRTFLAVSQISDHCRVNTCIGKKPSSLGEKKQRMNAALGDALSLFPSTAPALTVVVVFGISK